MADGTVVTAAIGVLGTMAATVISWTLTRRKHRAEADKAKAEADRLRAEADQIGRDAITRAHEAVQESYQELIDHLRAQVTVSAEMVNSAQTAARHSATKAAESEANAWRAEQQVRAMARFLVELRPVIAQYVPGAEQILERLDKFSTIPH